MTAFLTALIEVNEPEGVFVINENVMDIQVMMIHLNIVHAADDLTHGLPQCIGHCIALNALVDFLTARDLLHQDGGFISQSKTTDSAS